jgi:peptidyl-tRNA hydrolase, PTH1 family
MTVQLIVGLGNPGDKYASTRHNAGVWFLEAIQARYGCTFKSEKKFFGAYTSVVIEGQEVRLLMPATYMNESGRSVSAVIKFFRIDPANLLVAHDELDLTPGVVKIKAGGGLAGHNGLKDISQSLSGYQSYQRMRIGIGRPGAGDVTHYVLKAPGGADRQLIDASIERALSVLPDLVAGRAEAAMLKLHTRSESLPNKE